MIEPRYQSDRCTLYCADARDVLPQLEPLYGAMITDPPYGVGIKYSDSFADTPEYVRGLLPILIAEGERLAKVTIFPTGKYENELWLMQNYPPRWRMCWYKGAQSTASPIGFSDWEMIAIYGKDIHRYAHDYMPIKTRPADNGHPCPKDIKWATWLIHKFTRPDDVVIDPFMGSGTTIAAAMQTGRRGIGIEIDPAYYAIAERRIRQAESQLLLGI